MAKKPKNHDQFTSTRGRLRPRPAPDFSEPPDHEQGGYDAGGPDDDAAAEAAQAAVDAQIRKAAQDLLTIRER